MTGAGKAPWPLVELNMCRLYHCTPSELHKQDLATVLSHLEIIKAENRVAKLKTKPNKKPKRRRK